MIYDISRYSDEEIKGEVINKITMSTFRDIQMKDVDGIIESILKSTEYIRKLEDKQKGIGYLEILIRYIFHAKSNMTREYAREIAGPLIKLFIDFFGYV